VSSPVDGNGLGGEAYDVALRPLLRPGAICAALNGSARRWGWVSSLVGWREQGFRLVLLRTVPGELELLASLVAQKTLRVPLDVPDSGQVFKLNAQDCDAAYSRLRSRRARGKIVIQVSSSS